MDQDDALAFLDPFLAYGDDDIEEDLDLPSINEMFVYYDQLYFSSSLGSCVVEWSPKKMTRCAGICYPQPGGGCIMRLSEPLLKLVPSYEYKNTLLHEMIHAWCIVKGYRNQGNGGHGEAFFAKAAEINRSTVPDYLRPRRGYSIQQFHTMIREVQHYLVHHWQCNKCGKLIKRANNRRPQPADCRWYSKHRGQDCGDAKCGYHSHLRACQGEYVKIKEPEKQEKPKPAQAGGAAKRPRSRPDGTRSIEQFFKGPGAVTAADESREEMRARAAAAAAKRLLGLDGQPGPSKRVKEEPEAGPSGSASGRLEDEAGSAAAEALLSLGGRGHESRADGGASGSSLAVGSQLRNVSCPVCGRRWAAVSNADLNGHIDACLADGGVIELD